MTYANIHADILLGPKIKFNILQEYIHKFNIIYYLMYNNLKNN